MAQQKTWREHEAVRAAWSSIDQSPLDRVDAGRIDQPGLEALRKSGVVTADDVERSIEYFVWDAVQNLRFRGKKITSAMGLLMSHLKLGGYPRPSNYGEV